MSIVLKDGTVLPDAPKVAGNPYIAIFGIASGDVHQGYSLVASDYPGRTCDAKSLGAALENVYLFSCQIDEITATTNAKWYHCEDGGETWTLDESGDPNGEMLVGEIEGTVYTLVWANHDVKIMSFDAGTSQFVFTDEIYFANCNKFVLPDGTELPALPEGCFEKYPYGVIGKLENTDGTVVEYEFDVSISQVFYVPNEVSGFGVNTLRTEEYGCRNWKFVPGGNDWVELNDTPDEGVFLPEGSFGNAGVYTYVYSNHDILTATAMNDDYTFEIGPDLYRKSDVNYRIYGGWLNSMGNQARRLGGVSGELKPGEMETVFKGTKKSFPNGTEWTQSNITSKNFWSIDYANGLFVAGGSGVHYSTDGKNWTYVAVSGSQIEITRGNGLWVASSSAGAFYSTDGMTWTKSNVTDYCYKPCYGLGVWVLATQNTIYYSTNGKTWTQSNITNQGFYCVAYADGVFLAGSSYGSSPGLYRSTDGKSWTRVLTNGGIFRIVYGDGIWVAGRTSDLTTNSGIYYSTDKGSTWTQSNVTISGKGVFSIHYASGLWVASVQGNGIFYSTDGKTWTQSNITSSSTRSLYYADGVWVAGMYEGLYYSYDGKTWILSNVAVSQWYRALYHANGIWIAGSDAGLYYSVTWEP